MRWTPILLIRDSVFFASVQVEEWGHGVEWPIADIGIPADPLYRLSKEQSGDAFPTGQFNAWMKRHGLSLSAAAEALHLTRRTIIYYSTGAKPIPAYIGLACKGWERGVGSCRVGLRHCPIEGAFSSLA